MVRIISNSSAVFSLFVQPYPANVVRVFKKGISWGQALVGTTGALQNAIQRLLSRK
jgi:hypothetical protein